MVCQQFKYQISLFSQHLIVIGGWVNLDDRLDSTEVYSFSDNFWTEAGKLPARMSSVRAATVKNRVLLFGNYDHFITSGYFYFYSGGYDGSIDRNAILEYDPETKEWTPIGTMREARRAPAVSVVDLSLIHI